MLVTIDTDQLVRDAATLKMDNHYVAEKVCICNALQMQLCNEAGIPMMTDLFVQVREQVKEYKKLTMWRD
jgi:hypothetical protein